MAEKVAIIAATGLDAHNVVFTKNALESAAESANGERAVRMGANHDPFCMPYGKMIEAWVEPREDRHVLVARIYIEDDVKQVIHRKSGTQLTLLDFANFPKPFSRRLEDERSDQTEVHVDFVNFDNKQNYDRFIDEVNQIDDSFNCGRGFGRKSLIPEPFILFVLSHPEATAIASAVGLWTFLRVKKFVNHTVDETFRKVGDDLSDKLSAKIITVYEAYKRHQAQDERPVVTQLIMTGGVELNLLTRTEHDAEHQELNLESLRAEIEKYSDLLQDADNVTFGREGDSNWKFLYLTTKAGRVIGTIECFDRTLRVLDEVGTRPDLDED